ncbi:hypothetical protein PYW08_012286 [Mythimna loreyi]|uniref:Uncharacterized protein n=1 Tax=Mythimna loreyi TaxID=667449 RepID=A0ACC2Q002_9NEOP|nr:hypothetical protein PYW08_012286 [Mythimna loreyi]
MDAPKAALIKSKSSNSTSEQAKKNTTKNEKVSRSNAEFQPRALCTGVQPLMLKKRGVYVEKKLTNISLNQTEQSLDVPPNQKLINPSPMPRPSKKRFLTSVLTILSKSTAGTQCPDDIEGTRKIDKIMNKHKMREDEEDIREEWSTAPNTTKKKTKYKSKILNQPYKESFTVLQAKKDTELSSTSNSEYKSAKYDADIDTETMNWGENLEKNGFASAAGHSKKYKLTAKDTDPSLVSDIPKSHNKGIYDFFVDMIHTTTNFEGSDAEPHNQVPLKSENQSILTMESKESLTRKVNVEKIEESESFTAPKKKSSHHAYSIMPDERDEFTNRQMLEHFQPYLDHYYKKPKKVKPKRKFKPDLSQYKKVNPVPKTTSLPISNKKRDLKSEAKKDFLKILKEELQMKSHETFEEPENFYEALKVIARNKRLAQEWKSEVPSDPDDHICQFKPHRVLSRKSTGRQSSYNNELRPIIRKPGISYKKRKNNKDYDDETDVSLHSIEVTGYDYEPVRKPKKIKKKVAKKSTVTLISTPPTPPNEDFWKDYCDSDVSPLLLQRQYVLDKLMLLDSNTT